MNPKDIQEEIEEYSKIDVEALQNIYTSAAKAQYENDLDYNKLQTIIEVLRKNEEKKAEEHKQYLIKRAEALYKAGGVSRGELAVKLKSIGVEELDICTLLEKWDGNRR